MGSYHDTNSGTDQTLVERWNGTDWAIVSSPNQGSGDNVLNGVAVISTGCRVKHGAAYEAVTPDAADYLAAIDFADLGGLQAYLQHPAHRDLGVRFGEALSSAMVYDFEIGAARDLAGV